jgi:hypothetical protein
MASLLLRGHRARQLLAPTLSPMLMRSAKRSLLPAVPSVGPHALADIAVERELCVTRPISYFSLA